MGGGDLPSGLEHLLPQAWESVAACRGLPSSWWFPVRGESQAYNQEAKRICRQDCPVRLDCAGRAISEGHKDGLWGGMPKRDRDLIARQWKAKGGDLFTLIERSLK